MAQQAAGGKTQAKPYEPDVLVVGAGPAGMCAAIEATKLGAKVLLIDDKAKMGGQLVKQTHSFFGCKAQYAGTRGIDIPAILEKQLADLGVEIWLSSPAVGYFQDGVIGVTKGDRFVSSWRPGRRRTYCRSRTATSPESTAPARSRR
jgi:NADPH-dependent 2,4-dienoyl-CoA reductase/sulfur reductase-like enzyme